MGKTPPTSPDAGGNQRATIEGVRFLDEDGHAGPCVRDRRRDRDRDQLERARTARRLRLRHRSIQREWRLLLRARTPTSNDSRRGSSGVPGRCGSRSRRSIWSAERTIWMWRSIPAMASRTTITAGCTASACTSVYGDVGVARIGTSLGVQRRSAMAGDRRHSVRAGPLADAGRLARVSRQRTARCGRCGRRGTPHRQASGVHQWLLRPDAPWTRGQSARCRRPGRRSCCRNQQRPLGPAQRRAPAGRVLSLQARVELLRELRSVDHVVSLMRIRL